MALDGVGADGVLIAVVLPAATFVVLCPQGEKEREAPLLKLESLMLEKISWNSANRSDSDYRTAGPAVSLPVAVETSTTLKKGCCSPHFAGKISECQRSQATFIFYYRDLG